LNVAFITVVDAIRAVRAVRVPLQLVSAVAQKSSLTGAVSEWNSENYLTPFTNM